MSKDTNLVAAYYGSPGLMEVGVKAKKTGSPKPAEPADGEPKEPKKVRIPVIRLLKAFFLAQGKQVTEVPNVMINVLDLFRRRGSQSKPRKPGDTWFRHEPTWLKGVIFEFKWYFDVKQKEHRIMVRVLSSPGEDRCMLYYREGQGLSTQPEMIYVANFSSKDGENWEHPNASRGVRADRVKIGFYSGLVAAVTTKEGGTAPWLGVFDQFPKAGGAPDAWTHDIRGYRLDSGTIVDALTGNEVTFELNKPVTIGIPTARKGADEQTVSHRWTVTLQENDAAGKPTKYDIVGRVANTIGVDFRISGYDEELEAMAAIVALHDDPAFTSAVIEALSAARTAEAGDGKGQKSPTVAGYDAILARIAKLIEDPSDVDADLHVDMLGWLPRREKDDTIITDPAKFSQLLNKLVIKRAIEHARLERSGIKGKQYFVREHATAERVSDSQWLVEFRRSLEIDETKGSQREESSAQRQDGDAHVDDELELGVPSNEAA